VEIIQQLADKTDGVPLYVEEIAKAVLESGVLKEMDKRYELTGAMGSLTIPATLQDSLMARLDRLVTAKAVAQYASVIGRQFSYELLQAVVELDEAALQQELGKLVEAELIYQRGLPPQSTYRFKHALIQDTAYESLLRRTRRRHHQHIAHVLAERFPEVAEMQPELLAHHYTEAGFNKQAVHYWQRAGQRSLERLANREAIGHFTKGLEVLATLPDTRERAQQELILQTTLGPALMAVKGRAAPEIGRVYSRARQLCQQVGETVKLFPVLQGLAVFHMNRAELQTAREVGEQLLELAQCQPDPALLLQIHRTLGVTFLWLGEITCARSHLEKSIVLYDLQQHRSLAFLYGRDPKVDSLCYTALALWLLGYPDQALERLSEALTLARVRSHPYSLALALIFATRLRQYRREVQGVQEWAEAALSLSTEQSFPVFVAVGTLLGGWAIAMQGAGEQGVARMHQGLVAYQATTAELQRPWYLALLAEVYGKRGQAEAGLGLLAEALTTLHRSAECVHEAEVYRLQGELLLTLPEDNQAEAEICFHQALDIARRQQAKSWELRAATSLAKLQRRQGKRKEAYDLLAPVYGWFTEGFDTADLKDAKSLLNELV
jgi:predicted ATPase